MGTTVREIAEQIQQLEGYPVVIVAPPEMDLGDCQYVHRVAYDAYAGDLAAWLSKLSGQKLTLYVLTSSGRMIYSEGRHGGSDDRLDQVRQGWSDRGRLKTLFGDFGLKSKTEDDDIHEYIALNGEDQPNGKGDGNCGYQVCFTFDLETQEFKEVWTGVDMVH